MQEIRKLGSTSFVHCQSTDSHFELGNKEELKEAVAILLSKMMLTHTIGCALIYSSGTRMSRNGVMLYVSQSRASQKHRYECHHHSERGSLVEWCARRRRETTYPQLALLTDSLLKLNTTPAAALESILTCLDAGMSMEVCSLAVKLYDLAGRSHAHSFSTSPDSTASLR